MTLVSLSCHLLCAEEVVKRVLADVLPVTQLHSDEKLTLPLNDREDRERAYAERRRQEAERREKYDQEREARKA